MKAFQVMSEPLVWAALHESIQEAAETLRRKKISGLPVRDESGQAIGVLTRTDLAYYDRKRLEALIEARTKPHSAKADFSLAPEEETIEEWISPRVYTVSPEASLLEVIKKMLSRSTHRVFVRSKESGELIGVVTITDVLRHLAKRLHPAPRTLRLIAVIVALLLGVTSQRVSAESLTLQPGSSLWLEGKSTLHPYKSTATQLVAALESSGNAVIGELVRAGKIQALNVTIPVQGLQSGEKGLDKNMYAALKAKDNPQITFHLSGYEAKPIEGKTEQLHIKASGTLRIAGVEKPAVLEADAEPTADSLRVEGQYELLMTDFGIKPPMLMLGAIRVQNPVVVHYVIVFKNEPDATRSGSHQSKGD